MIHKVERNGTSTYVISSNDVWVPGCYDSERAAKYAFRFQDSQLRDLQEDVNQSEPDPDKRVITFEMFQKLREAQKVL